MSRAVSRVSRDRSNGIPQCLLSLKASYDGLATMERRIADFIMAYPEEVMRLTARRLAKRTGTSESTVVRLCQKIGFSGYPQMKLALAREIAVHNDDVYEEISPSDDVSTVIAKTFLMARQSLEATSMLINPAHVEAAVDAIVGAKRVVLCGVGGSGAIAEVARHKLLRLGIFAVSVTDFHVMSVMGRMLQPDDVVLAISHSGSTEDVVDFAHAAASSGARLICITNHLQSPLAKLCDVVLCTSAKETPLGPEAGTARAVQIGVIDALCMAVALKQRKGGR